MHRCNLDTFDGDHHSTGWKCTYHDSYLDVSELPVTTTVNGAAVPTSIPVWVCSGLSCNPDCSVPALACNNQDGPGTNGFPWPQPPPQNPPINNGAPVESSTAQIYTVQPPATENPQPSATQVDTSQPSVTDNPPQPSVTDNPPSATDNPPSATDNPQNSATDSPPQPSATDNPPQSSATDNPQSSATDNPPQTSGTDSPPQPSATEVPPSSTTQIDSTQLSATDSAPSSITSLPAASLATSGFVTTTENGQTTVVPVIITVGGGRDPDPPKPDPNSPKPGPNPDPPKPDPNSPKPGPNPNPPKPDPSNPEGPPDPTEPEEPCQTTIQCTQVCSVSATATNAPATTACSPDTVCKRQVGGCEAGVTLTATATTTTFTTISATGNYCDAEVCGATATLCPNDPPGAEPTNPPDAKIPTATDFPAPPPPPPSGARSKAKRAPEDLLTRDFINPENFLNGGRLGYYINIQELIHRFGPQNAIAGPPGAEKGIASSTAYTIANLDRPFVAGSGPSWGCTTVMVFSDKGMVCKTPEYLVSSIIYSWIAHFWEYTNFVEKLNDFTTTLDYFDNGSPANNYPSLASVTPNLFGDDALFIKAIIWTPNEVRPRYMPDFPNRTGKAPTDPAWYPQVDAMAGKIKEIVPAINRPHAPGQVALNQVLTITYSVFGQGEITAPENKLVALEYVPGHVKRTANGNCINARAIRVHSQDYITPTIVWPWPWPPSAPTKREEGGTCPANIDALLSAQPPDGSDAEFNPDVSIPALSTSTSIPTTMITMTSQTSATDTGPPSTTTQAAPSPTETWFLTLYDDTCDNSQKNKDLSYYFLKGTGNQGANGPCISLKHPPAAGDNSPFDCEWFTHGGSGNGEDCSHGTFTTPTSFLIRSGTCTVYENEDCTGPSNALYLTTYHGCTDVSAMGQTPPKEWQSMECDFVKG